MTDTIKLKKPTEMRSEFEDWQELYNYLSDKVGKKEEKEFEFLHLLPKEEVTDEMRKEVEEIKKSKISDFVDFRRKYRRRIRQL